MDDDVQTPTHRRPSRSLHHITSDQHASTHSPKPSVHLPDPDDPRFHEEPDEDPAGSDTGTDEIPSDEELDDDEETGLTYSQRKKRRRRKRRMILLDERVAGDSGLRTAGKRLARASAMKNMVVNALLIGLWYTFSISISVYNKWMFSGENLDFQYPLFTTSLHMLVQFGLASGVLYFVPSFRPKAPMVVHHNSREYGDIDGIDERPQPASKPLMTRWFYLSRITPCGTATALDIGLGNFSLRFISLAFYTMCKSSVLGFVLVFAFIFRLEKPTWKLCAIILVMTAGVIMMVAGETAFNVAGFALVMSASFCSGFRWSLTQILLLRNPATSNPFSSIFFLTPVMFLALFILALPIERPANVIDGIGTLVAAYGTFLGSFILLFPGVLAFLMVAAEFALLKRTSVVTLSVCGIFKEVLTISAAGLVFGDELSPINISGLFVTIASIAAYNYLKYIKMKQDTRQEEAHAMLEVTDVVSLETTPERLPSSNTEDGVGRDSRSPLMRDGLSLATEVDGNSGKHLTNGVSTDGHLGSPVKRPKDLE